MEKLLIVAQVAHDLLIGSYGIAVIFILVIIGLREDIKTYMQDVKQKKLKVCYDCGKIIGDDKYIDINIKGYRHIFLCKDCFKKRGEESGKRV